MNFSKRIVSWNSKKARKNVSKKSLIPAINIVDSPKFNSKILLHLCALIQFTGNPEHLRSSNCL